jgi:hypothetical protein
MAIKPSFFLLPFVLFIFPVPASLQAQSSSSFIELRIVQRLTWVGSEYAIRYDVIIEKEENGTYRRVFREFTTATVIEVSLSAGKYRYQVIPHDFLDQPVPANEWMEFEVMRIAQDDNTIPGGYEIIMVNPSEPENRREIVIPEPEKEIVIITEPVQETVIITPEPEIVTVTITSEPETITVIKNQFDMYFGLAYIPLLPIYGENKFFGENFSLIGAGLRIGVISALPNFLNFGVEITASWRMYEAAGTGKSVQSVTFDLNILGQRRFNSKTAVNARLGAGVSLRSGADDVSPIGEYSLHVNISLSLLWLPFKHAYIELCADYSQFFTEDYFGFFRPSLAIGYRY